MTQQHLLPKAVTRSGRKFRFFSKSERPAIEPWYFDYWQTQSGWLKACASDSALFSLSWEGKTKPKIVADMPGIKAQGIYQADKLLEYRRNLLEGENNKVSIDLYGTLFQCQVWRALLDVPVKKTVSYQELARLVGRPNGQRAVGSAVGSNPVFLFVPCHRVIASNKGLGGYAYGLGLKQNMLDAEQSTGNERSLIQI